MSFKNLTNSVNELRIHFCQTSPKSQGVSYMKIKKDNPALPVLIRGASGINAKVYARYHFGEEKHVIVDGLNEKEVEERLMALVDEKKAASA